MALAEDKSEASKEYDNENSANSRNNIGKINEYASGKS